MENENNFSSSFDATNQFYDGSRFLRPITEFTGLPIDQANFLACQLFALAVGFVYREYFGPHRVSPFSRHIVQIAIGIPLTYFCFGRQIIHLIAQSVVCFILMRFLEPGIMEKVVLVAAIAYLCICHSYRTIYDYGGYTLDITGPLMLNTQRLSSLAFSIRDGRVKDEKQLSEMTRRYAILKIPNLLEFSSYVFCFHGLMCGPFCFYKDYIAFIDGTNYQPPPSSSPKPISAKVNNHGCNSNSSSTFNVMLPPNPTTSLQKKLLKTFVYGIMTILVLPKFPKTILTGPEFFECGFLHKMFLVILFAGLQRQKYYFAWKLGESVNASAGLGFNGYDERGQTRWDLIDNVDVYKVEFSLSLKELLDNWNRSTMLWLRYIVYDRVRSTIPVFFFSAFWHGFYAGYYMTFFTGGIFIHTARLMRRRVRPYFLTSNALKLAYDTVTFLSTRIAIAYLGFPFLILELWPTYFIYRSLYFWMHFAAIGSAVFVLLLSSLRRPKKQ